MFPETLLPELPHDGWAMVCRGHDSFIRTSAGQGFPLDVDSSSEATPFVLAMAVQQAEASKRPKVINLYGEVPKYATDWAKQLDTSITRASQQEWFVCNTKPAVNLLQGEFQPSGGISRRLVAFKPVAITLAGLLIMQISFSMFDYAIKMRENRKLDQEMVTQFKATFPNATTIVDAPLQMQRNLDDLKHGAGQSGNADFMPLLATATTSIGAISAERLKGMDYQNGKLVLNLLMPDMEQAQAMRQRLSTAGLSATIESSHPSAQGLDLQLVISASAS
jgi:general secretion pathway protein L